MIRLETFCKSELVHLLNSDRFRLFPFLPITDFRAQSQCRNPKATEDDVLLILAFADHQLAGYLGILPDEIFVEGTPQKMGWFSTIYVDPQFRGQKIAQKMMDLAFNLYDGKVVLTEFTPEAERLFSKTKALQYGKSKLGKRYYFSFGIDEILPQKFSFFHKIKPFLTQANSVLDGCYALLKKKENPGLHLIEMQKEVDAESALFLQNFPSIRNADDLNWIMKNPWVVEGNQPIKAYSFSSFAKSMDFFWVKIFSADRQLKACAMLSLRDGHLKIPYLFTKQNLKDFTHFLNGFIQEHKVKFLTCYHDELNRCISENRFPKLFSKDFERRYFFHENFVNAISIKENLHFQDGDGDWVFT